MVSIVDAGPCHTRWMSLGDLFYLTVIAACSLVVALARRRSRRHVLELAAPGLRLGSSGRARRGNLEPEDHGSAVR